MADSGSGWTVVDFERMRGDFPIRTFLATLEGRNKAESAALIQQVAARGNQLREPRSKKVEGTERLFELRSGHQLRIFYCFQPGRGIVLLDGIVKKQDRIPAGDLARVLGYLRDVERRGPRAP
jgi:hypothetical protein